MAKHKKTKDAKRDRRDAGKLPKRIAGVKVPKTLRKGGAVRELAESPAVRDILAAALTSAAAVVAGRKDGKGAKGERPQPGAAPIVAAFAAAAVDVVRQLRASGDKPKGDGALRAEPTPPSAPPSTQGEPGATTH